MKEIFKPVPYEPYSNYYSISNLGRARIVIKSQFSNTKTGFLRPGIGARRYVCYTFYYKGQKKQYFAHRMVLLAFMGLPPKGKEFALHIDDNKKNNSIKNLIWGSHQDNMDLMVMHNRQNRGKNINTNKLDEAQVKTIRQLYKEGSYSQTELAATFDIDQTQISRIVLRKSWKWL